MPRHFIALLLLSTLCVSACDSAGEENYYPKTFVIAGAIAGSETYEADVTRQTGIQDCHISAVSPGGTERLESGTLTLGKDGTFAFEVVTRRWPYDTNDPVTTVVEGTYESQGAFLALRPSPVASRL